MSFYLAFPSTNSTEQTVSTYVRDMGLSLLRAKPSDINAMVVVAAVQPGYACYIANLPYFIRATMMRASVPIGAGCAPFAVPAEIVRLPWSLPPLIYDYTQRINDRQVATLLRHSETVTDGRSRNQTFIMGAPTLELIQSLMTQERPPQQTTRHVFGTVNLDAMKTIRSMIELTTALICTHNYPAVRTVDDLNPVPAAISADSPARKKRRRDDTYLACMRDIIGSTAELTNEDMEKLAKDPSSVPTIRLTTARPSDVSTMNWGPIDTIPNADGMYVPYVKELAVGDSKTVPDFIQRYLAKSLGDNLVQVSEQLRRLYSAWGVIRDTAIGREMAHLYKCLDIAVRGQAAVYPVFTNGLYEGAVIWGTGFIVGINGALYKPVRYAELQTLVQSSSMHSKAIREIKQLTGDQANDEIEECTSIRGIATVVQGMELSVEQQKGVVRIAHKLCYENKYWAVSPRYVKMALELLVSEEDIDDSVPMYPSMLFSTDRVEQVLSAFGYQSFSFIIPNGQVIRLDRNTDTAPRNLHVRTVELSRAISDMRHVMEAQTITNNNQNLSSRHKDLSLNGPSKTEVWNALVAAANNAGNNEQDDRDDVQAAGNVAGNAFDWDW